MADPNQDTGINWAGALLSGFLLVLAVVVIENQIIRALVALGALFLAVYMTQQTGREEGEVENPLLDQLRDSRQGLDRRKYGRLRAYTDRLLEHVRAMNRLAVDARQGKMSQRHAHAELDRLAAMMRDVVDEVRKAAGVPTPVKDLAPSPKPQVVFPRKGEEAAGGDDGEASEEAEKTVEAESEPAEPEDEARARAEEADGEEGDREEEEEGLADAQLETEDEEADETKDERGETEEDTERALARRGDDSGEEDEEKES